MTDDATIDNRRGVIILNYSIYGMNPISTDSRVLFNACLATSGFYARLYEIYFEVFKASTKILLENKNWSFEALEKRWLSKCREIFELRFKEEEFGDSLSSAIDCFSELAQKSGIGWWYQNISNLIALWNNYFIEPVRDTFCRTPSHKIYSDGKFSLFHYDSAQEKVVNKSPVLIIYAFINRHYILDLLPEVSIVRSLHEKGIDLFAADWGTPSQYDRNLTVDYYVNNYLDKSIDNIREYTNSDKVSLFGYCWGGDLALIYAAQHPEKVKSIITLATPGDFNLDNGLVSLWTKKINADTLVSAFGNAPGMFLNSAFALRSPIDYFHKYIHFFEKPRDIESISQFFATEMWLYDSPPVVGEIYREFVKDFYQDNLLIRNQINYGNENGQIVNLKNIKVPFLNILAKKDDLVSPKSSKALSDALGSTDKSLFEFDSGHVGACISSHAHKELWPKVGEWIINHS
jgi:class III poly(R)-hydroxyalkanoic acid synthase PhaC subunit